MTDTKPGPCPFPDCGSEVTNVYIVEKAYHVMCNKCGAQGPIKPTPAEAVTLWNAPGEKIERLEALVDLLLTYAYRGPRWDTIVKKVDAVRGEGYSENLMVSIQKFSKALLSQQEGGK